MNLTTTHIEILQQLSNGQRATDIAKQICLSPGTIEGKIESIRNYYKCKNTVQLIAKMVREGII